MGKRDIPGVLTGRLARMAASAAAPEWDQTEQVNI